MIYEFCAENLTDVPQAIQHGAHRIELCDNLAQGGTTPSFGVLQHACIIEQETHIPFMPMLRPRGGDFCYSSQEKAIMLADVQQLNALGFQGLVFGALTKDKQLDVPFIQQVMAQTTARDVTFHMAFDSLPVEQQFQAIDTLAQCGFTRILTHGGAMDEPIEQHLPHLHELIQYANQRLIILPGGGITHHNRQHIASQLGVQELHGTRIVDMS